MTAVLPIILTVLLGRFFCGWICPGRWIFNRGPAANSKPGRTRTWMQRAVIGGVIGASFLCHTPVFCVICPAGVVCRGAIAAGTGGSFLPAIGWRFAVICPGTIAQSYRVARRHRDLRTCAW